MATKLPEGARDSLNTVLQLGYPFGLRQTNHNLWDERQNQQDTKPTLGCHGKAKSKETALEAMFESQEQVQEWCVNFPDDIPLSALMEQRQYLIYNGLLEREKTPTKVSGECECDIDNIDDGEDRKEIDEYTAITDDEVLDSVSEQDGTSTGAEVISCGSLHTDGSSIGSKEQTTELRQADEEKELHQIIDDITEAPTNADDDVGGLGQVHITKVSEEDSQQCTMSAVVAEVQACNTADGGGSSTVNEQTMAQMKEDETVVSLNEESFAPPATNPSTDIVERPDAILEGWESGKDTPRERTGRMRTVWRAICGGARRVGRFLLPCLRTPKED